MKPESKLKILLVEDNIVNQKVTLHQLKHLGYTADVAANGQEALDMLAQIAYNLVLMDCQMPVLDGYSATRAIRSREQPPQHTIIIALTANALLEDRERCLASGMDDYLSKPIFKEKLQEKLLYWGDTLDHYQAVSEMKLAIDWEHLHQISDGNAAFERELLHIFMEDTQTHLTDAQSAIVECDRDTLERAAHHVKGSSANLGLYEMQAFASQLEDLATEQDAIDRWESLVQQLVQQLEDVRQFLKQNAE